MNLNQSKTLFWRYNLKSGLPIESTPIYRKASYPYDDSLTVSINSAGSPVSKFSDDVWDFTALEGGHKVTWSGGRNISISPQNLKLVKSAWFGAIHDRRIIRGKIKSSLNLKSHLAKLAQICDQHRKSDGSIILISELSKFPKLLEECSYCFNQDWTVALTVFAKMEIFRESIGFVIFDEKSLTSLTAKLSARKKFQVKQHPVIPPRIWDYQVNRLEECLEDFFAIKHGLFSVIQEVEDAKCFNNNILRMQEYTNEEPYSDHMRTLLVNPFSSRSQLKGSITFSQSFESMLESNGVLLVLKKYHVFDKPVSLKTLNTIIYGFQTAAMTYIQFFSMQRMSEAMSLYSDCLHTENDPRIGQICMLVGETTKTQLDSDARWIVPSRIVMAIDALKSIAELLIKYLPDNFREVAEGPYPLWMSSFMTSCSSNFVKRQPNYFLQFNNLFESSEMKITESDLHFASVLTPDLPNRQEFEVGRVWKWTSHQCRRTLIVYMLGSGLVKLKSVQYMAKHMHSYMTQYYGRNYSKLILNGQVQNELIAESYLSKARLVESIISNRVVAVKPYSKNHLIDKIPNLTFKKIINDFKSKRSAVRPTLLGCCTKIGSCEYGGVESVSKCAGSDGGGICSDAIFLAERKKSLEGLKKKYIFECEELHPYSSKAKALRYEIKAIEIYEDKIKNG